MIKVAFSLNAPGTLRSVCARYYDEPDHGGCPFTLVCLADNGHPKDSAALRIVNTASAETLEAMATEIRRIQIKETLNNGE